MDESKKKFSLTTWILVSLIMGLIVGLIINSVQGVLPEGVVAFINKYLVDGLFNVIGSIFINSIKMMVVPLVTVSLIVGVTAIGDIRKLGRVGGKTLFFYLCTTSLAIALALLIGQVIDPGQGLSITKEGAEFTGKNAPKFSEVLIGIVPTNPIDSMVKGNMLQIIMFSVLMGLAMASLGKKVGKVIVIMSELNEIFLKMVTLVMLIAPIGVFCLIAKVFSNQGLDVLLPLIKYMMTVFIVLFVHLFLVYSGALRVIARLSVVTFFKKFYSALLVAFSTSSSNATIPVTMKVLTEKLGVSKGIASFSIPFGATINMDGTAIMQGVAVVFISQVYGVDLSMTDYLLVIATATLASVGTAGVPGVGLITLSMVLTQVGLPVEGIALIIGVDRLLDMTRTAVNISGDAIVSIIVAKGEGEFKEAIYNDPEAGPMDGDDIVHEIEENIQVSHAVLEEEENRLI